MTQPQDVQALLDGAVSAGELSPASTSRFSNFALGKVTAGLGTPFAEVDATEGVIVAVLLDDSDSINTGNNVQNVIDGMATMTKALKESKQKDGILLLVAMLNKGILYPFTPIERVPVLDYSNYQPYNGTPLYERFYEQLLTVAAKVQDADLNGTACRSVLVVITDGQATDKFNAQIRTEVEKLLSTERHLILAMGVDDGHTDYTAVFTSMGIPAHCVLTTANSESEWRRAFNIVSRSIAQASQSAALHSQVAQTGFGVPTP